MKYSIKVTLKKDLKSVRQGKYFEIEVDEKNEEVADKDVTQMCEKLLANLMIEDYKINKLK